MGDKLKLEDLKIGMKVSRSQLDTIFNIYIFLKDFELDNGDMIGIIASVTSNPSEEVRDKVFCGDFYCIINDEEDMEGDIFYEE